MNMLFQKNLLIQPVCVSPCLYKTSKISVFPKSTYYLLIIAFDIADFAVQ